MLWLSTSVVRPSSAVNKVRSSESVDNTRREHKGVMKSACCYNINDNNILALTKKYFHCNIIFSS